MEQKITSTITKGFVIGLVMIAITLGMTFSGMAVDSSLKWLSYIIFITGVVIAISQYGKQINYNSTFGNYFAHGFKISALVTIIMIAYSVIFISVFPEFKEQALDAARKQMQSNKNISEDNMEKGIEMTKRFFMIGMVGGILLFYLITGAIASLIGAAITKKHPQPFQDLN
ncbi:MAG: hypothetical protein JWN83_754 [Chitinophagaceae bacterium]|nr:hypothetical protein [Chitinophagaceae bacterium]